MGSTCRRIHRPLCPSNDSGSRAPCNISQNRGCGGSGERKVLPAIAPLSVIPRVESRGGIVRWCLLAAVIHPVLFPDPPWHVHLSRGTPAGELVARADVPVCA